VPIDDKAIAGAARRGLAGIHDWARNRVVKSVGPAQPFHDGWQTPRKGHIV
jgi:hypothetical protein